jgi:putative two-component system response regulator
MDRKSCVLIVDDEPQIRALHARLVEALGHRCETAADGVEALAKLALGVDLVLLDGHMPNMDGFEVATRIREMDDLGFLPIVMVSGLPGGHQHRRALEVGINDFISKPIDIDELHLRTNWLLELTRAHDRLNERRENLERSVAERTAALREALQEVSGARRQIFDAHLDTIHRLTVAAELKDRDTGQHIERIGLYAKVLAYALDMAPGTVETVRHAAPLHDVGKLGIPDHILLKPGKLDDGEMEVMRTHTTLGAALLAGSESRVIQMGERIALSHHERWDGQGYPNGLGGDDIPIEARICAVVDVFDALTMDRPYRPAVATDVVLDMMRQGSATHFDPVVLRAFFDNFPAIEAIRAEHVDSCGRAAGAPGRALTVPGMERRPGFFDRERSRPHSIGA